MMEDDNANSENAVRRMHDDGDRIAQECPWR